MRIPAAASAALVALTLLLPLAAASHPSDQGCAVTPGGWGAPPRGNNAGALLHGHFDEVFGDSLVVGGFVFEDAQSITNALPSDADPLFNHAVALAINLGFGGAGLLNGSLSGVVVDDGTYAGSTAEEILALAEEALEDPDRSTADYSDLIEAMTGLNEESYGCNFAPPCPTIVAATPMADGSIHIQWTAVDEAESYVVYRATGDGEFVLLAFVEETMYTDATTAPGQSYSYMVTAWDGAMESEGCEAATATAIPFFPGLVVGALALGGSVGAFAWMRRRT